MIEGWGEEWGLEYLGYLRLYTNAFSRFNWELFFFWLHEAFQLVMETHRISDPGSGEGGFPINKHWIKPSPSGRTLPWHIACCIFYIHNIFYTIYCRWATTNSKLLRPNFFHCLGDEERSEQAKLWVGGGELPPLFSCWAKNVSIQCCATVDESRCVCLFFDKKWLHEIICSLEQLRWGATEAETALQYPVITSK